MVRISEILTGGAKPTKGPKPKPERKARAGRSRLRPTTPKRHSRESPAKTAAK